ncbi:MAG: SPFH domain-containing protein [Phycisphaerales bacterium]|jgi:regulator of protease activity HflC (stomatin/prohibitin superfamily)|nr:SPFH domain-containing protein [Phycisphaerales bacterium]
MTDNQNNPEHDQRREQSAKFVLSNTSDSSLDIRDAMDTAHRSLADSLQLSFRALQAVMMILVVLYLISGFRSVEDSQTGVATFFGSIINDEGLSPGLQTNWPPPIGGFEIYDSQSREADIGGVFKPRIDARLSQEQRVSRSKSSDGLKPGRDGSLLTGDGDLAHISIRAEWEIVDPIQYSDSISDATGNDLVEIALERAAVHVVGKIKLEELLDKPLEELRSLIQIATQQTLTDLQCGIRISDVSLPSEPEPPLFIQKSYDEFDSARIVAETNVERATAQAHEALIGAAGSNYEKLLKNIEGYEQAAERKDEELMNENLEEINKMLQSDEISGKVAHTISNASGYRAQIETTLGHDYKRFKSLLPTYRKHPELVIRNKWLSVYSTIVGKDDVETIFVPEFIAAVKLGVSGSDSIAQIRHNNQLKKKEARAYLEGFDSLNPWILRASEIDMEGPSRELSISGGSVQGRQ